MWRLDNRTPTYSLSDLRKGDNRDLSCQALNGDPFVQHISIKCRKGKHIMASAEAFDNKVNVRILLNRTMDQMECTCQAKHALREFRANITINVKCQ